MGNPLPLLNRSRRKTIPQSASGLARSETWRRIAPMFLFATLFPFGQSSRAQGYSIDWFRIAGGDGVSGNGQYSVGGTIGRHDAGDAMSGGIDSLTEGLGSLNTVAQTAGARTLNISHRGNTVTVYWRAVSGWSLQQNSNLTVPAGWSADSGAQLPTARII